MSDNVIEFPKKSPAPWELEFPASQYFPSEEELARRDDELIDLDWDAPVSPSIDSLAPLSYQAMPSEMCTSLLIELEKMKRSWGRLSFYLKEIQ